MFNTFTVEKRQREKNEAEEKQKKFQEDRAKLRSRNDTLFEDYEKKLDKFLEHLMDHPMPKVDSWVLNETYFVEQTKLGYKDESSKHLAHHCFRMTFNCSQKQRIEENLKKNQYLLTEFTPHKPHEFRSRNKEGDVNPPMRYQKGYERSSSADKSQKNNSYNQKGNSVIRYPRIKDSSDRKKGVKFIMDEESEPIGSDIRSEVLSKMPSDTSSPGQEIGMPNYNKSPFKTLQQCAVNHKLHNLQRDKELYDKMIDEIYYPSDKSKLPKRMYQQSKEKKEFPYSYSIDSDNNFLDYEVEDDVGQIDDPMLFGKNPPKKPKVLDRNVLEKKILHSKLRSMAAQNALVRSNAVKQNTSFGV